MTDDESLLHLRKVFDRRLASLRKPDARHRLRAAFDNEVDLHGSVKVGPTMVPKIPVDLPSDDESR